MRSVHDGRYTAIELFAGAGGLALGTAEAGFKHAAVVEWDSNACASLRHNATRIARMADWPIHEMDARRFDYSTVGEGISLIAAGAPCQPFSLGGKHRGHRDDRNLFPEVFRAVRELLPEAVVIENVKGLLRKSFSPYFEYILLQLRYPHLPPSQGESWEDHKERLRSVSSGEVGAGQTQPLYEVDHQLLNAADFGLPQRRERVFIVAFRRDLGVSWEPLQGTHSQDALLYTQYVTGSYWDRHGVSIPNPSRRVRSRVAQLGLWGPPAEKPWVTVRDALSDLPEPMFGEEHPHIPNHAGNDGARTYPGHTGSPLDEPAKTLKAGDHGVPGGENMLRRLDGTVRYFTIREAARLQGFPDEYILQGSWTEAMRQLGNAVPVGLAKVVATAVREKIAPALAETKVA